jgi:hypothetical protein
MMGTKLKIWHMVLLALLVTMVIFRKDIAEFIDIDSCLDSGGRWDEVLSRCDFGTKEECLLNGDYSYWDVGVGRCEWAEPDYGP